MTKREEKTRIESDLKGILTFGEVLRKVIQPLHMTQKDIAALCNLPEPTVTRVCRGEYKEDETEYPKALAICKAVIDVLSTEDFSLIIELVEATRLLPENKATLFSELKAYHEQQQRLTASYADLQPYELVMRQRRLIGRKRELDKIFRELQNPLSRIITISGTAGVGKTRLILEVVKLLQQNPTQYPYNYIYLTLAGTAAADTCSMIAKKLGEQKQPTPKNIAARLANKLTLFIIDNIEHVIDPQQEDNQRTFFYELLEECEKQNKPAKLVFTSQRAFNIQTEIEIPLHPLSYPRIGITPKLNDIKRFTALQLFFSYARKPINDEDLSTAIQICQGLEGLPLAIVLAASRVSRTFTPQDVYDSLIKYSIKALRTTHDDVFPRHINLEQALMWSYNLLSSPGQTLFRRLSVFYNSFTPGLAEEVCNAPGDIPGGIKVPLQELVKYNLLQEEEDDETSSFSMLQTIHMYAREKLLEHHDAMVDLFNTITPLTTEEFTRVKRIVQQLDPKRLLTIINFRNEPMPFLSKNYTSQYSYPHLRILYQTGENDIDVKGYLNLKEPPSSVGTYEYDPEREEEGSEKVIWRWF